MDFLKEVCVCVREEKEMAFPYGGFGGGFGEGGGFPMPMMGGRCGGGWFVGDCVDELRKREARARLLLVVLRLCVCRGFGQQNFSQRYHAVPVAAADKTDTKALEAGGAPLPLRAC